MRQVEEIARRYENAVVPLLLRARTSKEVGSRSLRDALEALEELAGALEESAVIPIELVGTLWFPFTALLAEAEHAKDPAPLLDAAWEIQEKLRQIFGPHW